MICHKGKSLEVTTDIVSSHLSHGDMLGSCSASQPPAMFTVTAMPNPSSNHFVITIGNGKQGEKIDLRVMNLLGKVIEQRTNLNNNQSFTLGNNYHPGLYIVEVQQGNEREKIMIVKLP